MQQEQTCISTDFWHEGFQQNTSETKVQGTRIEDASPNDTEAL